VATEMRGRPARDVVRVQGTRGLVHGKEQSWRIPFV